jgi:hypothetical protein
MVWDVAGVMGWGVAGVMVWDVAGVIVWGVAGVMVWVREDNLHDIFICLASNVINFQTIQVRCVKI